MKRYVDFELQISSVDGQIVIDINGRPKAINLPEPIKVPLKDELVNWKELASSLVENLAERGYSLYSSVFVQEVEKQFQAYLNRREEEVGVRLCIYTQSNDITEAVWEILCSLSKTAFEFLALNPKTPVVRRTRNTTEINLRPMQAPLKLLVVLASPRFQKIDAVKEKSSLQEALQEAISEGQIEVDYLGFDDATEANFDTLQEYLSRQETRYDVVHIIAHGLLEAGEEGITALVKPENLRQQTVSASSLANLFRERRVMLVILQSCQSGAVDSSVLSFSSVAQQLVACGVPAVLAMQENIDQDVATYFLKRLYKQWLGAGCPFEDALTQARHGVYQNFADRIVSWAIPVLYISPLVDLSLNKEAHWVESNQSQMKRQERQLDAALPQKTCLGKETELLILIRVPTQSGLRELLSTQQQDYDAKPEDVRTSSTFEVSFPVDEKTEKVLPTNVKIEILTNDFDLSKKVDKVQLRPQGDSVLLIYPITPIRAGTARIYVFIYDNQEQVTLAQLRLKSEVQVPIKETLETEYRVISTTDQRINLSYRDDDIRRLTLELEAYEAEAKGNYRTAKIKWQDLYKFNPYNAFIALDRISYKSSQAETEPYYLLPQRTKIFNFETVTVNRKGEIVKKEVLNAIYYSEDLGDGITLDMVYIPEGTFMMGSPEGEGYDHEKPQHQVTVKPFFMGKFPVTQAQWKAIASRTDLKVEIDLNPDPSYFKEDPPQPPFLKGEKAKTRWDRPVEDVNWYQAVEFCQRLSKLTGRDYRRPSEAEWEYACRAGTTTPFYFGETITSDLANYSGTATYVDEPKGEYRRGSTSVVGTFPPNAFGLYDMHGNVWELCEDNWHDNYDGAPIDGSAWITERDTTAVVRGGSCVGTPQGCRSASRNYDEPLPLVASIDYYNGFRVVCVVGSTS